MLDKRMARASVAAVLAVVASAPSLADAQPAAREEALQALKKAATFYRTGVASHGGYLYYYSPDLKDRWGEGKFTADTIFVQPPGTPTVGMAYLRAYRATGDVFYLDAARETAEALVAGQLQSGGWTQAIHFAKVSNRIGRYRKGNGGSWNISSFDDGQTQSALRMLVRADEALGFKHAEIHEAAQFGLEALLKAQFANGAFPQVFSGPVAAQPVVRAKFPDYDWKTEGRIKEYWNAYTLNDGLAGTVAETLIEAHAVTGDAKVLAALERLGDFLILAQMPAPQPGWCQQYNTEMVPIWARKFEPPAITGWESQDVMETLIRIARVTGNKKYLDPIPPALEYYKKLVLPDGRIPRYIEFGSNKPLYMDAGYRLTYDDSAAPGHYGWKQEARFEEIEKAFQDAKAGTPPPKAAPPAEDEVRRIVRSLDTEGRWITTFAGERLVGQPKFVPGFAYVSSAVFSTNVETLSDYVAASKR